MRAAPPPHRPNGAPAAPAGRTAPPGQPSSLPSEDGAPAPGGRPQRHDAQPPAPSRPNVPSPAAWPPSAAKPDLDSPTESRCRSPDAHLPSRRPGSCASGRPDHADASAEPVLFTKEIAARRLSVSVRQLSRFVVDGSIKPIRLGPRLVRFTPEELAAFVVRRATYVEPPSWAERLPVATGDSALRP